LGSRRQSPDGWETVTPWLKTEASVSCPTEALFLQRVPPESLLPQEFGQALTAESPATATAYGDSFQRLSLPKLPRNSARSVEWLIFVTNHGSGASVVTACSWIALPSVLAEEHALFAFEQARQVQSAYRYINLKFHTVVFLSLFVLFFHQPWLTHFAVAR